MECGINITSDSIKVPECGRNWEIVSRIYIIEVKREARFHLKVEII